MLLFTDAFVIHDGGSFFHTSWGGRSESITNVRRKILINRESRPSHRQTSRAIRLCRSRLSEAVAGPSGVWNCHSFRRRREDNSHSDGAPSTGSPPEAFDFKKLYDVASARIQDFEAICG